MTKPRTPEEIAYDVWVAVHTPGNLSREAIFAALREAADAARREEREALRVWLAAESLPDCEACAKLDAATTAREALRPAAPSAQHVEMDEGESCSCGWTSHTKAWRAHAAHMRRRGETTSENSLPLGHEFEPCPSLMPDGFPARFCVLKSPKQTECHFWHLHPAHYCGQPESAHRRKA